MNNSDAPEKDAALGRRDFLKVGVGGAVISALPAVVGSGNENKRRRLVGREARQGRGGQTDGDRLPRALVAGTLQQSARRSRPAAGK